MYEFQKVQDFSSLCRAKTHSRHLQGHHGALALRGSNYNNKNAVHEMEYQKTVNVRKLAKWINWFLEVLILLP